jgi:hypothetical protein
MDEPISSDPSVVAAFLPPRWLEAVDDEQFDHESFRKWQDRLPGSTAQEVPATAERTSLPQLIKAWKRGLRVIIVLPFSGQMGKQLGTNGILLSSATYLTPEQFSSALANFTD